jgi:hypothetical protein
MTPKQKKRKLRRREKRYIKIKLHYLTGAANKHYPLTELAHKGLLDQIQNHSTYSKLDAVSLGKITGEAHDR